jgi:hypothetical protein
MSRTCASVTITHRLAQSGWLTRSGRSNCRYPADLIVAAQEHVEAGSTVNTDAHFSYQGLSREYAHVVIDHAEAYVDGTIHTNGLENYWSLLKRSIKGTYVSVEPFHLFRYLDEQAFRFNQRKGLDDYDRFKMALSQIVGKRLTWKQVVGMAEPSASLN